MLPYDKTALIAAAKADTYSAIVSTANPISTVIGALDSPTTAYIGSDYLEISGKRFSTKQLAYLLSKLLDEHPECQV